MVLEGSGKERQIALMVKSHVGKAERARRHGRELSFILPHNSVDSFSALFSAIEEEIRTGKAGMGISSYGVSMTTLEEVSRSADFEALTRRKNLALKYTVSQLKLLN